MFPPRMYKRGETAVMYKIFEKVALYSDSSWMFNAETFDWNPGVFLAGAAAAYKKTGDERILDYLKGWCERHLDEAGVLRTVNSSAPLIMVADLYELTSGEKYRIACEEAAEWLLNEAPLTVDGGLEHTVTEGDDFGDQMWADTLFMAVLFAAKWGRITGNTKYKEFAAQQLVVHHKFLRDEKSRLYFHGWDGRSRTHMSAARWARANAWVILASGLIMDELEQEFEGKDFVVSSLNDLACALRDCQHENGGFSTVLDRPESYCESSATAGIAAGIFFGVAHKFFPKDLLHSARKAAEYVNSVTKPDGSVTEVSTGTPVMPSVEAYFTIERGSALYGQGLALFMHAYEM